MTNDRRLRRWYALADDAGAKYLRLIHARAAFEIAPFDEKAAIEAAISQRAAFASGDKKSGAAGSYQKSKVDRQVVVIAKVAGCDVIYTTDRDVVNIAQRNGVGCKAVWELPLPAPASPTSPPTLELQPPPSDVISGDLPFETPSQKVKPDATESASETTAPSPPATRSPDVEPE